MIDAFARETRPLSIDGHLVAVDATVNVPNTATTARCHFVARDGNENVLVSKLARKLAMQVVDYCIPRSRVDEALASGAPAVLALEREAVDLFVKADMSGEAGELLLYFLLEAVLGLPQLLCKMPLKTNPQMHVHGSDGIHGSVLPSGQLALYWGESKLHADIGKAIGSCFRDLVPYLRDDGTGRTQRDLELLRDHLDLRDEKLVDALARYFCEDTIESTRIVYRGAVLIGFDLDAYPTPHEADGVTVRAEVAAAVASWFSRVSSAISTHAVDKFEIEVFCVPFPSVADMRTEMLKALRLAS
jgi:hypothetical protein